MKKQNGGWIGFMTMTFAVVGLTGLFATYAAPLPLERAMQRENAFDLALAQDLSPAQRAELRDRLGEDAAKVLDGPQAGLAQRVETARQEARQRFTAENAAVGNRLRLLIIVVTCAGGLFGIAMLTVVGRQA